jgi:hypothetical protein
MAGACIRNDGASVHSRHDGDQYSSSRETPLRWATSSWPSWTHNMTAVWARLAATSSTSAAAATVRVPARRASQAIGSPSSSTAAINGRPIAPEPPDHRWKAPTGTSSATNTTTISAAMRRLRASVQSIAIRPTSEAAKIGAAGTIPYSWSKSSPGPPLMKYSHRTGRCVP